MDNITGSIVELKKVLASLQFTDDIRDFDSDDKHAEKKQLQQKIRHKKLDIENILKDISGQCRWAFLILFVSIYRLK